MAKVKAFVKLRDNAYGEEKKHLIYLTNDNFTSMEDMKIRINFLENNSSLMAYENDQLKRGAENSIYLINTAEEVQNDLEIISIELAEKAVMIRKLLEDNMTLNKRLQKIEKAKR
jgi:hypothetical protein